MTRHTRPSAFALSHVGAMRPDGTALVFLGVFGLLAAMPVPLLNDPDTQWHIAIGRSIAETRALPWTDTFSHTFAGQPWIAKEWLSQLLLSGASALAGWPGVALLTALAAAGTLALLHGWLARRLRPSLALAITLSAFVLMAPHLVARPHVLVLPVTLLWACGLAEASERRSAPPWTLLLAMVAWANLHASFTFGFALAGAFALDALWRAEPAERVGLAARWAVFLALSLLASCATPYGYRSILVTPSLLGKGEPLPYIGEWQPLALDGIGGLAIALMASTLLLLLRQPKANLFRILLVLGLGVMTLRYARFLDLFALLVPVAAADPIARSIRTLRAPSPASVPSLAGRMVCALIVAGIVALTLHREVRPDPRTMPEAALEVARARGLTAGRVFNEYDFGGFLIAESVKTYIDGRNDQIYLGGFTRTLNEAIAARDDGPLLGLLDRAKVSWALVRPRSPESRHLGGAPDWQSIYADEIAEVFVRGSGVAVMPPAHEAAAR